MSAITTHVLDTARGLPAAGIPVILWYSPDGGPWQELAAGLTDADGRISDLVAPEHRLEAGTYRLRFELEDYLRGDGGEAFYPHAEVIFRLASPEEHYHIPLLLSPFGYTTYRGS